MSHTIISQGEATTQEPVYFLSQKFTSNDELVIEYSVTPPVKNTIVQTVVSVQSVFNNFTVIESSFGVIVTFCPVLIAETNIADLIVSHTTSHQAKVPISQTLYVILYTTSVVELLLQDNKILLHILFHICQEKIWSIFITSHSEFIGVPQTVITAEKFDGVYVQGVVCVCQFHFNIAFLGSGNIESIRLIFARGNLFFCKSKVNIFFW